MAYNPKFLRGVTVEIPKIDPSRHPNLVSLTANKKRKIIDYEHHSVVLNKDRKLAIVSACNIDGELIPEHSIPRKGAFADSPGVEAGDQLGKSFYQTAKHKGKSVLDKGHLTKYEDVIWGKGLTMEEFVALGKSTNYYTNAVPQHQRMNRGKWKSLELYILDTETQENEFKICMFTGPVLNESDPVYTRQINGKTIQIPILFWKIVVYQKNGKLFALGFLMSHKSLLIKTKLVREIALRRLTENKGNIYFMDYKHSKPYQVKVELIEEMAGIKLKASKPINKPYKDDRPLETITREINVRNLQTGIPQKKFLTSTRFTNLVTVKIQKQ